MTLIPTVRYAAFALLASLCPLVMADQAASAASDETTWTPLFDESSIDESRIKSGFATYKIEDGVIVGTTEEGSPNTFYCSEQEYGDFELEFEVQVDRGLNSGVQIRSTLKNVDNKKAHGGRLNGPQVEIETGPGQSGYIYGEATGLGWLSPEPQSKDPAVNAHDHFDNDGWNRYRVVAKGPRIQTFLNGKPIADLTHEEIYQSHPSGLIGLQVHGIGKDKGPYQVRWRNLRIRSLAD